MSAMTASPVKYAGRTYLIEFVFVMTLYVAAAVARPWLLGHLSGLVPVVTAKLLPIAPIWLMLAVVWRHYRRIDEYAQHRFLVTLAVSFGIGSCLIVSYALLMDAGLTPLAITWAWPTLAACWAITSAILSFADR